jgi:AGCS family alanine or glycine:cation symporter
MSEALERLNSTVNGYVWGWPMIGLLMGTGLLLTVMTGAVQFRRLAFALREVLGKVAQRGGGQGDVRPFQAVATALASTVGVGNIAGVATAIGLGGPGAVFWLWVSGLLGMATKYAEIVVALHYREPDAKGAMRGGAMYVLKKGLGMPWFGSVFALLTALAAFGIGNMVQAHSVADALKTTFSIPPWATGLTLVVLTAMVILGGIKSIARVTQWLVPFMAAMYLVGAVVVLVLCANRLPEAFGLIFQGAFSGTAAAGGFAGSTVMMALRYGIARGLFSNEAGLGSAPMAHCAADTDHPVPAGNVRHLRGVRGHPADLHCDGPGHSADGHVGQRFDRRRFVRQGIRERPARHIW